MAFNDYDFWISFFSMSLKTQLPLFLVARRRLSPRHNCACCVRLDDACRRACLPTSVSLRADAIGIHNHLKELEEDEGESRLTPAQIEESFSATMAGISDVLMILADMKRHKRESDDEE